MKLAVGFAEQTGVFSIGILTARVMLAVLTLKYKVSAKGALALGI